MDHLPVILTYSCCRSACKQIQQSVWKLEMDMAKQQGEVACVLIAFLSDCAVLACLIESIYHTCEEEEEEGKEEEEEEEEWSGEGKRDLCSLETHLIVGYLTTWFGID